MKRLGTIFRKTMFVFLCTQVCCVYAETNGKSNFLNTHVLKDDTIRIGPTRIAMPIGRVILIRKDADCCALMFTDAFGFGYGLYKGEPIDMYAHYIAVHQEDGSGDFTKPNVNHLDVELLEPTYRGFWASLFGPKRKATIECGAVELAWVMTGIHFFKDPEHQFYPQGIIKLGIELAPTPWKSIQDVNISDPRIKWYKYDERRSEMKVAAEQIWSNTPLEPSR